jgi:hypothetical protein
MARRKKPQGRREGRKNNPAAAQIDVDDRFGCGRKTGEPDLGRSIYPTKLVSLSFLQYGRRIVGNMIRGNERRVEQPGSA